MILIICTQCTAAFRVMGGLEEVDGLVGKHSEWWPSKYPCVQCGGTASAVPEEGFDVTTLPSPIRTLEAEEMFIALQGGGLPEERVCTEKEVAALLLGERVAKIKGYNIAGTSRYCLEWIEFADGSRMHLVASTEGAIVHRIVPKPNHAAAIEAG